MSKLASSVMYGAILLGSFALVACGGDDDGGGGIIITDGGSGTDDGGGNTGAVCNPVSQAGCAGGEKCASVTVSDGIYQTKCMPDGTADTGEACMNVDVPGEGATDDCVGGNECVASVCQEVCTTVGGSGQAGSCSNSGDVCAANWSDLYVDVADTGICAASCDVGSQNCAGSQGCFFFSPTTDGSYTGECLPASAEGFAAGEEWCPNFETSVGCASNSCAIGSGPHMFSISNGTFTNAHYQDYVLGEDAGIVGGICAEYCTPDSGNLGGGSGGCGQTHRCGYIVSFDISYILDDTMVPDAVGICMESASWDSCPDGAARLEGLNGATGIPVLFQDGSAPPFGMTGYVAGCYSFAELDAAFTAASSTAAVVAKYGSKEAAKEFAIERFRAVHAMARKAQL